MNGARCGAALCALLLAVAPATAQESLLPPSCEGLLEQGGFDNRFRVIDPLARVTACRMKGVIEEDVFEVLVNRRVEQWSRRCFTLREQSYLHGVLRQATMQTMPFVSRENCAANLERLLRLPEPRGAR